jgi:hypothetical protein
MASRALRAQSTEAPVIRPPKTVLMLMHLPCQAEAPLACHHRTCVLNLQHDVGVIPLPQTPMCCIIMLQHMLEDDSKAQRRGAAVVIRCTPE